MSHRLSALIRSAVFVSDLDRSTEFYRALGMTAVYYEGELDPASSAAVLHVPEGSRLRARILKKEGGPNFGMIGLFELTNPPPEPMQRSAGPPRLGEVALVFYANPVDEAVERARSAGATWSPEPVMFNMPHRSQREVCLRDPDGVLINLVERDPFEQERLDPVTGPPAARPPSPSPPPSRL